LPKRTTAKPAVVVEKAEKAKTSRQDDLRQMLLDRQQELQSELRSRMEDIRAAGPPAVQRLGEDADADAHQEVELAMLQIKAETLKRIDAALERIEAGAYGDCVTCGDEIPKNRLKALPFAVRCTACEHERERGDAIERQGTRERPGVPLLSHPGPRY